MNEKVSIEENEILKNIFNNMPSGMIICEAIYDKNKQMVDCKYLTMNQVYADLTGLKEKNAIGERVLKMLPGTEPEWFSTFGTVVKTGKPLQFEMYHDVTNKHYLVRSMRPKKDIFIATFDDITERVTAKQLLIESEARFKALSDSTFEAIFISENGICIEANKAALSMFGYTYNDLIGIFGTDVIADESKELVKKNMLAGYEEPYEALAIKKNGEKFFAEFRGKMFVYKGKETRITAVRDITRRKETELKLQKSEEKLKSTIASIDDLVFVINKEGKFKEYYNPSSKQILFKEPEVFYNKHYLEIGFPESVNKKIANAINSLKKSDVVQEFDYELKIKDEIHWFNAKLSQQKDNLGNFSGITIVAREITDRKTTEVALVQKNKDLIQAEEKLRATNEELKATSDALKENNDELELAIVKAEEADRLKTAFLMNMSHEIRTPMNGIIGFTKLLSNNDLSISKRDNFIKIIGESSKQLLNIINDIIDISKIETGQFDINVQEICINDLLLELFAFHEAVASKKDINLYLKKPLNDQESTILTDSVKLRQILDNLISNALKFTHKGFISIGYKLIKKKNTIFLQFYIEDTGIGIKKEMHDRVFDQFRQADNSHSKEYGGTGIGLSIAKAYVQKLGGDIYINSQTDKGTTFYFTVPYKRHKISENNTNSQQIIEKTHQNLILVVEDEEINYLLIEEMLIDVNAHILHARTGAEAIDYCENNPNITLILMDIKLPDISGYEVTKKIRSFRKDLAIVAQTSYALHGDREKSLEAGCNDYITKPMEKDDFMAIINPYLIN